MTLLGLFIYITPVKFKSFIRVTAALGSLFAVIFTARNFVFPAAESYTGFFNTTVFPGFIALACAFFCLLIVIFSFEYAKELENCNVYYSLIVLTTVFSISAVMSSNFIVLAVFWGLSGLTLYLLANLLPSSSNAAKKTFIYVGGSDSLLVLGIVLLWKITGSFDLYGMKIDISENGTLAMVAFLSLATAALTKAGAMPFHTWIPDFAKEAPISVSAFLPGALDKLLGIFLLVVISTKIFVLSQSAVLVLLITGSVTIICAVFMAMAQHDIRKLLAYHSVSQVGYMIVGISTGSIIGLIGGIFHMLNNAVYKSALFLTAAAVEKRTKTTHIDRLGGLHSFMPVTFAVCVIAAMSISGIPPFNGFASKWMIYQAMVTQYMSSVSATMKTVYLAALLTALFGSALTLASFMKLIHSVFMSKPAGDTGQWKKKEVKATMLAPMAILAFLCVVFGAFPIALPVNKLILPSLREFGIAKVDFTGLWQSQIAALLIFVGILLGLLIYVMLKLQTRTDTAFVGGEKDVDEARALGSEFYGTVTELGFFRNVFALAERKYFDLYELSSRAVLGFGRFLSSVQNGRLNIYMLLMVTGMIFFIVYFMWKQ